MTDSIHMHSMEPFEPEVPYNEPFDFLAGEIITHSIRDYIYSFQDHCPSVATVIHQYTDIFDPKIHFQTVLHDLIRVTHCHSCGERNNVCFFGYVGEHCKKRCMKDYDRSGEEYYDTTSEDYEEDSNRLPHSAVPCGWCDGYNLSRAHSRYHSFDKRHNASGYCWPMLSYHLACENECIRDRPIICIPGYNSDYYPPDTM